MRIAGVLLVGIFLHNFMLSPLFSQSKGGRWQFENNGFDTANWDNHSDDGTLQNGATYLTQPAPPEGSAYLFLDTAQNYNYFKIPDNNDLDFDNENIGISAWIYPLVINDVHFIVNKGRQDSNPKTTNYALRISLEKKLEFLIRDANNQAQKVASSFTIPENQWTFVAAYYDYSQSKVYMWNDPNSFPVDTLAFSQNFFSNNDPLSIGGWYNAIPATPVVKEFEGGIDDVRISGRLEDLLPPTTSIDLKSHIEKQGNSILTQVFPNPVNLHQNKITISVRFLVNPTGPVYVKIYNILGQMIFQSEVLNSVTGTTMNWNLQDAGGNKINTGVYFIHIDAPQFSKVSKLVIVK